METETDQEPKTHLDLLPIKHSTEQLCESIVDQEGFAELYKKIEAFINDEKLKYEYGVLNDRGALLQQMQENGMEIKENEIVEFEKLREEFMNNTVATDFLEAQEEEALGQAGGVEPTLVFRFWAGDVPALHEAAGVGEVEGVTDDHG
jgi:cell fate (sporulation/competence/biofilm development) regulator YlbF (YheA/YmcA/DUF963 family)